MCSLRNDTVNQSMLNLSNKVDPVLSFKAAHRFSSTEQNQCSLKTRSQGFFPLLGVSFCVAGIPFKELLVFNLTEWKGNGTTWRILSSLQNAVFNRFFYNLKIKHKESCRAKIFLSFIRVDVLNWPQCCWACWTPWDHAASWRPGWSIWSWRWSKEKLHHQICQNRQTRCLCLFLWELLKGINIHLFLCLIYR